MTVYSKNIVAAVAFSLLSSAAYATDFNDKATSDWQGKRNTLADYGITVDAVYRLDSFYNSGGLRNGFANARDLDLKIMLDGSRLYGIPGQRIFLYPYSATGNHVNGKYVGSTAGLDTLEVSKPATKFYELWVEQSAWDNKASIRAGLYDPSTEFYYSEPAGMFLNGAYVLGTELVTSDRSNWAIFSTSPSVRLKVEPTKDTYAEVAMMNRRLWLAEVGFNNKEVGHIGIGAWRYMNTQATFDYSTPKIAQGTYIVVDKSIYKHDQKDISVFARGGITDGSVSPLSNSWSTGIVFTENEQNSTGIALSQSTNSNMFMDWKQTTSVIRPNAKETTLEATHTFKPKPWFKVQPDVQYTMHPGTDRVLKDATTVGVRLGINF